MTMAIPASLAKPRRIPRALIAGVSVLGILAVAFVLWKLLRPVETSVAKSFYTIAPMDLDIVIRKDGELQSVKNVDIVCPVEGSNTIKTIIPEGSSVKKGRSDRRAR